MTDLDPSRPHVVTAPHEYSPDSWWGACTCGAEFFGASGQEVRVSGGPHRAVQRNRQRKVNG